MLKIVICFTSVTWLKDTGKSCLHQRSQRTEFTEAKACSLHRHAQQLVISLCQTVLISILCIQA